MKNKVDWFGYFFPVIRDIQEINRETDTEKVAKNNYRLANNEEEYKQFIEKLNKNRQS